MRFLSFLFLFVFSINGLAQELTVKTYGDKNNTPIIFLHGGPGYNSVVFEQTAAKRLAENKFYVISYDRRGEGRNFDKKADYTFNQTFEDLNFLFQKFQLQKSILIGHSFGGVVATLFTEKYPEKVSKLVLVGAPASMQETLKTIVEKSKKIYTTKDDKVNLNYISMLEKMDAKSLQYSSYTFMHAMQNGFYSTKQPNKEALEIYKGFQTDSLLKKHASKMEFVAPQKFWENESYTSISLYENLKNIKLKGVHVYGLYGKEDGLFSQNQITKLQNVIGEDNLQYLDNCSHSVFIDQQTLFVDFLKSIK